MKNNQKTAYMIAALIALIGLFHLFVPRSEHKQWRDDANMFINHARNITEGRPYSELDFIPNPSLNISPAAFPPVFPLIIAPVYKHLGIDRAAMKAVVALFFIASLVLFVFAFSGLVSPAALALMVVAIGMSPFIWLYTEMIISDIPFLFFILLSLIVIERAADAGLSRPKRLLFAAITGLLVYLTYGTRSVGVILIPAVLTIDYLRSGRLTALSGVSTAVFAVCALTQSVLTGSASGYSSIFTFEAKAVPLSFYLGLEYVRKFSYLWENGYARVVSSAASVFFFLFAVSGYIKKIKTRVSVFEPFTPLYLALVVIYSAVTPTGSNPRYLVPLVPLYFFYAFYGIEQSGFLRKKGACGKTLALAAAIVIATYIGEYSKTEIGWTTPVEEEKESVELFDFLKNHTAEDSVFITRIPRSVSLYTSRKTAFYHTPEDERELWDFFARSKATHLIVGKQYDSQYIIDFAQRNRYRLDMVFSNSDFLVFDLPDLPLPEVPPLEGGSS